MENNTRDNFKTGDIVKVYTKDPQAAKVHATPFEGIVIATRGGKNQKTFTVRKVASHQVAVERIFPLNSPTIERIQLIKKGSSTRARLYFLRKKDGAAKSRF